MIKLYADDIYEAFFFGDDGANVGFIPDKCVIFANGERIKYQQASLISLPVRDGTVQSLTFVDEQGWLHHGMIELKRLAQQSSPGPTVDFHLRAAAQAERIARSEYGHPHNGTGGREN